MSLYFELLIQNLNFGGKVFLDLLQAQRIAILTLRPVSIIGGNLVYRFKER